MQVDNAKVEARVVKVDLDAITWVQRGGGDGGIGRDDRLPHRYAGASSNKVGVTTFQIHVQ